MGIFKKDGSEERQKRLLKEIMSGKAPITEDETIGDDDQDDTFPETEEDEENTEHPGRLFGKNAIHIMIAMKRK